MGPRRLSPTVPFRCPDRSPGRLRWATRNACRRHCPIRGWFAAALPIPGRTTPMMRAAHTVSYGETPLTGRTTPMMRAAHTASYGETPPPPNHSEFTTNPRACQTVKTHSPYRPVRGATSVPRPGHAVNTRSPYHPIREDVACSRPPAGTPLSMLPLMRAAEISPYEKLNFPLPQPTCRQSFPKIREL